MEEDWNESDSKLMQNMTKSPITIRILLIFLTSWQFIFNISNNAMDVLISFWHKFLFLLAEFTGSRKLRNLINWLPSTYNETLKVLGLDCEAYIVYVLCPKCNLVYNYDDCVQTNFGRKQSKKCVFVNFPRHPQRKRRDPCNTTLLAEKFNFNNELRLIPRKIYPYCSLKKSFTRILSQPDFLSKCEHWRSRSEMIPSDILGDIYDANVWQDFATDRYDKFLEHPGSLLLGLNCDWFQPFSNTQYSVGALYLTVLNLPRKERYNLENIILVSIIPGPKEPKLTLNPLLAPFVEELISVYDGWMLTISNDRIGEVSVHVRACLACVSCDVPAMRKLCGFLGHTARLGCSRCLKEFTTTTFGDKPDYSGFDQDKWIPRSLENHKLHCKQLSTCCTKTTLQSLESQYGVRYSLLLELPHFDPIRFGIIDPMHNLMLGTSKHMFSLWLEQSKLSQQDIECIQKQCEKFLIPYDVGRLPLKIGSNFAGFTADQWRTWTTVLSAVVLKGILPERDYTCWILFVNACRLLCSRIITKSNVRTAHDYLTLFCKKVETIYGKSACTPNMHLHLHLAECLLDFGPVHTIWCYSFERFNGILGAFHTNNKNIEVQIMKKFLLRQQIKLLSNESIFTDFQDIFKNDSTKGSLSENDNSYVFPLMELAKLRVFGNGSFKIDSKSNIHLITTQTDVVLSSTDYKKLKLIYEQLYPHKQILHVSPFATQVKSLSVGNEIIRCTKRSGVIMAYWPVSGASLDNIDYTRYSVGVIKHFLKHFIKFAGGHEEHLFCYIIWKQRHPCFDWYGQSATISSNLDEREDACCFMPVQRIAYRCATAELSLNFDTVNENVLIACPINMKYHI